MERMSCVRSIDLLCLGGSTESSDDDESEWVEGRKGVCAFSGAFPLVGDNDNDLTEREDSETGKAEDRLVDRDGRRRPGVGCFFGDSALLANSKSFFHTLKKSVNVQVDLISLTSVGKSSCNRARIIIWSCSYRWSTISWLARKRIPFFESFGIYSCRSRAISLGFGPKGRDSQEAA